MLLKTTVGKMFLQIHIEIFLDFLRQTVIKKYGPASDRTVYITIFLDSLQKDITEFLDVDFMKLKEEKEMRIISDAIRDAEYLAKKHAKIDVKTLHNKI